MSQTAADVGIAALASVDLHRMRGGFEEHASTGLRAPANANLTMAPSGRLRFELVFAQGENLELELRGSGAEPATLWRPFFATIQTLARLSPDWDSYGAKPLSQITVQRVLTKLLPILLHDGVPEAAIVPTRDGGLQFEWHRRGIDVEIRVPPEGPIEFLVSDPDAGVDEEQTGPMDEGVILAALQRMSPATN